MEMEIMRFLIISQDLYFMFYNSNMLMIIINLDIGMLKLSSSLYNSCLFIAVDETECSLNCIRWTGFLNCLNETSTYNRTKLVRCSSEYLLRCICDVQETIVMSIFTINFGQRLTERNHRSIVHQ